MAILHLTKKCGVIIEDRIELRPANPWMKSIVASAEEVEVAGIVMGLVRNHRRKAVNSERPVSRGQQAISARSVAHKGYAAG